MKWKTTKKLPADALAGIKFETEEIDGSITSATLEDADGRKVRFSVESFNFRIAMPAPAVAVERWRIEGRIGESAVPFVDNRTFEHQYGEINERKRNLASVYKDAEFVIASVEMLESEVEAEDRIADDIPF